MAASHSIVSLAISITTTTLTINTAQQVAFGKMVIEMEEAIAWIETKITSLQFSIFIIRSVIASSVQIGGGSWIATSTTASDFLIQSLKIISLNEAAVMAVTTQLDVVIAIGAGTETSGKLKSLLFTIICQSCRKYLKNLMGSARRTFQ